MSILDEIKDGRKDYFEPDDGIVTRTYITDEYVLQEPIHEGAGDLRKNRHFTEKLSRNGLNVPEVVEFSEDPLYVVFQRINGQSLEERENFSKGEYFSAISKSGEALARIHEQEGRGYGKPDQSQDFEVGRFDTWKDFVEDYAQGALDYVKDDRVRETVEKAYELIDFDELPEKPDSRVLHMDYTPDNLIMSDEVYVIDFDGVRFGDPDFEFLYTEFIMSKRGDEIAEAFTEGYQKVRETEIEEELSRSYKALAVLRDARGAQWCIRKDKDVDIEEWSQGLKDFVETLD